MRSVHYCQRLCQEHNNLLLTASGSMMKKTNRCNCRTLNCVTASCKYVHDCEKKLINVFDNDEKAFPRINQT